MSLQYGSAATLDMTAEATACPSITCVWSLSRPFAFFMTLFIFPDFIEYNLFVALDKKLGFARGVLVGWPSVQDSKEKLSAFQ